MNIETLNLDSPLQLSINLTDEQFWQLCQRNREYRFEANSQGDLIIMPPTGSDVGRRNIKITTQLEIWNSQQKLGIAFDSSTGFTLSNGAKLGWLIDRQNQQVEIYRVNKTVEIIKSPSTLSGENILPNFTLDLTEIL
jgi:Uma2 family endonuclease